MSKKIFLLQSGLSFLVLLVLMSVVFVGFRRMESDMKVLYEDNFEKVRALTNIRRAYRDLGYRLTGYVAGVETPENARRLLKDSVGEVRTNWERYRKADMGGINDRKEAQLLPALDSAIKESEPLFAQIDEIYRTNRKERAAALLRDSWFSINEDLIQPAHLLQEAHTNAFNEYYKKSKSTFHIMLAIGLIAFIVGIELLIWGAYRSYTLQARYDAQVARNVSNSRLAALGEIAGGMAHEINNPLAIIIGLTSQISQKIKRGDADPIELLDKLARIDQTCKRITRIIKSLLTVSRDGSRDPFQTVPISSILDIVLELCSERFRSRGVRLEVSAPSDDIHIHGREAELSQVLLNLLNNAIDAVSAPTDNGSPEVRLEVLDNGLNLEIAVVDSGPGVPAKIRDKIFDPFFTTKEVGKGAGLGLSTSANIIRHYGGQIFLDPSSTSTRFVVQLPKIQANGEPL